MTKLIVLCMLLFIVFESRAQKLVVVDDQSGHPIEGVIVHSIKNNGITDSHGTIDLTNFQSDSLFHFTHTAYLNLQITRHSLSQNNFVVSLKEDPVKLDEVVVSANRRAQSRLEVPQQIISISQQEITRTNPQTTADLLDSKGGVFIQKSQLGGGSPMIRGLSANRLLLVVDGIRMNNAIYRNGNLQNVISLDAASLEQTEVIFGPGSVMYGSDALGGVLHFKTLSPKLSTSSNYKQARNAFVRYASANFEKTVHADFNFGTDKLASLTSLTFSDFDDLLMGKHGPESYLCPEYVEDDKILPNDNTRKQIQTGYSQFNFMQKFRYRPNSKWDFNYAFHWSATSDIPRYDRLIQYSNEQLKYAEWFYGPQKWKLHAFDTQWTANAFLFDQARLLIGWQAYDESRNDRHLASEELTKRKEHLDILTLNFDLDKQIDQNNTLFYGFEGNFNWIQSEGEIDFTNGSPSIPTSSRYPDGSKTSSIAAYASYKLSVSNRFILNAGSRLSVNQLSGTFDKRFFDFPDDEFTNTHTALTGNLGFVFHPTPQWQLNAAISTGFRSPNIDDVAKVFDSSPGNVIVPNPDLKPEYVRNFEIGILRSIKNLARFELNFYYTYLNNAMVRRPYQLNGQDSIWYENELSQVEALVNADYANIYGGDFSMEWILASQWKTRSTITTTWGKDSEKQPVRHVAPIFGSSHLIYQTTRQSFDLYLRFNGELSHDKLVSSEQDKAYLYATDENGQPYSPGWATINLKANTQLSANYQLSVGFENILNKRYRPYSSGIVAPGRQVILTFRAVL